MAAWFARVDPSTGYANAADRAAGTGPQCRSVVVARHGMVATSQPLATLAGLDVLRAGGNAADAAIAANAVLGVVEPMSCGLGGDLFVLYWDAKSQRLYGLNASGRSPRGLTREWFVSQGLTRIPDRGPLSWSVPGCVQGWDDLRSRFGSRPLGELLRAAIEHAEDGFAVSELIAADWRAAAPALAHDPGSAATFLVEGRGPAAGQVMRNPRLAATLRQVAEGGPEAFYRGSIAEQLVAFSREVGGHFAPVDFAEHRSEWVEPVSVNYRGYDVYQLPPNGQGLAVLQMLNLLGGYDLASLGPGHPDVWHLFVEAKKLAYADRARFYADPAFAEVPIAGLVSRAYAEERRRRIDSQRAARDVPPGDPRLAHGDTIYLSVVDRDRNCCSLIQSTYYGFGSLLTPPELGFTLQNRGALFTLDETHPNRFEPGKRPFHTIIPGMVLKEGRPTFCFGVMGGDMQPQGQVQVLMNLLDFGMNPQAAGDAPRVRHDGSPTPTGLEGDADGGTVVVESGVSEAAVEELERRGHRVVRGSGGFGGYQGIWIDHAHGTLHGASESRKDGCALGY